MLLTYGSHSIGCVDRFELMSKNSAPVAVQNRELVGVVGISWVLWGPRPHIRVHHLILGVGSFLHCRKMLCINGNISKGSCCRLPEKYGEINIIRCTRNTKLFQFPCPNAKPWFNSKTTICECESCRIACFCTVPFMFSRKLPHDGF